MNNKNAVLIIVMFVLFCSSVAAHCHPIEVLFKYREQLEQQAKTCELDEKASYTQQRGRVIEYEKRIQIVTLFREMSQKNLSDWKRKDNEIIDAFLELCWNRIYGGCSKDEETRYNRLTDTVLISILVETLGDLPKEKDKNVMWCLEKVPYPYLNNYRTKIFDRLRKFKNVNRFRYLAAVINPPAAIKKDLLALDSLSVGLKARLGDEESEKQLIQRVDEYAENGNIQDFAKELFLCGSDDCLKAALELFVKFKPIMRRGVLCTDRTNQQRVAVIYGFRKYYPESALLHKEYYDVYTHVYYRKMHDSWDVVTQYMQKFVDWGNKEYGTDFKLKDSYLFGEQCDDETYKTRRQRPSERKLYEKKQ